MKKNIDILGCHNALENFPFLPVNLLHSLALNVANLRKLYDVIIVGDIYNCVSTPTVCTLVYDVIYNVILEVPFNKNLTTEHGTE